MKIFTTKDYSKFKTITGNREVLERHVKKLVSSIESQDLTEYMPIIVNAKMQVIDGQHRLEALKQLGLPVNYVVIPGAGLGVVQQLNSTSKSWSLQDYVQSFIEKGNQNYITLEEYRAKYELPLTVSAALLAGVQGRKHLTSEIKDGDFEVKDYRFAANMGTYLMEIRKYVDKHLMTDRDFLAACIKAINAPGIDLKQLLHKVQLLGMTLERQLTVTDYMRELERLYNYKTKTEKMRLF